MNFFFGIKNNLISSNITIPRFQNNGYHNEKYSVYDAMPKDGKWSINKTICQSDKNFFYIDFSQFDKKQIFFLATELQVNNFIMSKQNILSNLNNFTNTSPIEFRSNLRISINKKGFSSYQSEYPIEMTRKKGSILSPLSSLLNSNSEQNLLFFKNIYFEPIFEKSKLYIVDMLNRKIIDEFEVSTNETNEIEIKKEFIKDSNYFFTEKTLGIPLFVSIKDDHLSFEHTHPPHLYLLNHNRFNKVSELKQEVRNIINLYNKETNGI